MERLNLRKGSLVYTEGRLQTREYEKDGVKRYATDIVANEMRMLGGKADGASVNAAPATSAAQNSGPGVLKDMDDDIPF